MSQHTEGTMNETFMIETTYAVGDRVRYLDSTPDYPSDGAGTITTVRVAPFAGEFGGPESYRVEYTVEWDDGRDNGVYYTSQLACLC